MINDIVESGGLTHSGRCYAIGPSRVKEGEQGTKQSGVEVAILKKKEDQKEEHCQYHKGSVRHSIQDCQDFLDLMQEMMDEGKIEFYKEVEG